MNEKTDKFVTQVAKELVDGFTPEEQGNIINHLIKLVRTHYSNAANDFEDEMNEANELHEVFMESLNSEEIKGIGKS